GNTKGRCTKASKTVRPRKRPRASIQATRMAGGKLQQTLRLATAKLRYRASLSLGLNQVIGDCLIGSAGLHPAGSILCVRTFFRIGSMAYYRAVAQAAASTAERSGVLVVNLGTPDSPSYLAVQRYLREFLGDRRVIDTAPWFWLPLLYAVILPLRPIRTTRNYRKIWMQGGSPLAVYSRRLAEKISTRLQDWRGDAVRVELAMTYGNPGIA